MQEYVLVKKQSGKLTNLDQGQDGQLKFEYARICAAIPYLFRSFDVGENIFYKFSYVKTSKWVERKITAFHKHIWAPRCRPKAAASSGHVLIKLI
jgi:hypothetical protein